MKYYQQAAIIEITIIEELKWCFLGKYLRLLDKSESTFSKASPMTEDDPKCCKHYFPVKLNYASTVNVDEKQCADFLVAIKLNYYVYLSSEIMLKSDGF